MQKFSADQLRDIVSRVLLKVGASAEEAELVSRHLVEADLRGVHSHGVMRIPEYIELIRRGGIKPQAKIEVVRESPTIALINGNWGFGQVIGVKAMDIAITKARDSAVGCVGVFNCNHIGMLAYYTMMALDRDMIGIAGCNGGPAVAPFGGASRALGTNPLSFAIPTGEERPVVLDMATSIVAEGKVRLRMMRGEKTPEGWILDSEGNLTTDPSALYAGGALLPFGGYKGYGLGLIIDIICGALTGAGCGRELKVGDNWGQGVFMMAIDISSFTSIGTFKKRVDMLIRELKSSPKATGFKEILVAGELEFREKERGLLEGVQIDDKTWQNLEEIMGELGVARSSLERS
jgi:LDH2 family malate/lactate/ureidoglycolate dehydrogenase